jgi:flagellar biosynthesis/type III secretory pathway chaperone
MKRSFSDEDILEITKLIKVDNKQKELIVQSTYSNKNFPIRIPFEYIKAIKVNTSLNQIFDSSKKKIKAMNLHNKKIIREVAKSTSKITRLVETEIKNFPHFIKYLIIE